MCGVSLIFQILCCLRLVSIPTLQLYNDTMVDTMASCEALFLLSKSVATHTEHTIYHKCHFKLPLYLTPFQAVSRPIAL